MKKTMLMLMATMAVGAYAQDAQELTASVENITLWNYTTTAWKDYQVNEQSFDVTAVNLTENISWVMESSGKAKGNYIGDSSTRFELINYGLYENRSGQLAVRVTSKEAGTFWDVVVLKSGDVEYRFPVTLKVAGTEGDGYWDDADFAPLSVADANLIHDVMNPNTSYATDDTHKFNTPQGDYGYRFFRGTVGSVTEVANGTATFVLTNEQGQELTVLNAKGVDKADITEADYVAVGDVVTLEGDIADKDGVCALQDCYIQAVEKGSVAPVANPAVTMEETEITPNTIELTFTPNDDCATYHCCLFGVGEIEEQFMIFGAWMGFQNYGDMVKAWGFACSGVETKKWKDLAPNTTYEIYVQPIAADGSYGELQCFAVTTTQQGGDGPSVISIVIGEFGGDDELGHWQQVIYTPNEETAVYFDLICTEEYWQENGAEGVLAYLQEEDDPTNMYYSYYAHYDVDNAIWEAEEGTKYHACAVGKNGKGEWGEMSDVIFTTPGVVGIQQILAGKGIAKVRHNVQGQQTRSNEGLIIEDGRVMLKK